MTSCHPCCQHQYKEIDNIAALAKENNLKLNISKSKEVLFCDSRRGNLKTLPSSLPNITRESSLKIVGATFSNNLSASDHICHIVSESAQMLHALWVLRLHGLSDISVPSNRGVKADVSINSVGKGEGLSLWPTSSESVSFSAAASTAATAHWTYHISVICWWNATTDFSIKVAITHSASCSTYCCLPELWSVTQLPW